MLDHCSGVPEMVLHKPKYPAYLSQRVTFLRPQKKTEKQRSIALLRNGLSLLFKVLAHSLHNPKEVVAKQRQIGHLTPDWQSTTAMYHQLISA